MMMRDVEATEEWLNGWTQGITPRWWGRVEERPVMVDIVVLAASFDEKN